MPLARATSNIMPLFTNRHRSADIDDIKASFSQWELRVITDWSNLHTEVDTYPAALFYIHPDELLNKEFPRELEKAIAKSKWTAWVGLVNPDQLHYRAFQQVISHYCHDYFTAPLADIADHAHAVLGHVYGMARFRKQLHDHDPEAESRFGIIGSSSSVRRLQKTILKFSESDATVLISGESGTGKELVAHSIHNQSLRQKEPFVAINCGAIPQNLVESELFGHEKGAFTGADKAKMGLIESAHRGTLFLDEVGELPKDQQVKLLRFLQEGTIDPIGALASRPVDVRVIAASHINLEDAVRAHEFREDLFFRLNVLQLEVPRLADREGDIETIAKHYFDKFRTNRRDEPKDFSPAALLALQSYNWPGNVRELMNRIQKALIMCEGDQIEPADLGLPTPSIKTVPDQTNLEEARNHAEKEALVVALRGSRNNVSQAARNLGISRMTLYRLIEKHQIQA